MGVVQALLLLWLAAAPAPDASAFRRTLGAAEIDWNVGTITAEAGAAADLRMPNPNAARPGALRRARAAAEEKLRGTLRTLAAGAKVDEKATLARAKVTRTEYQSNGGVVLWLGLGFSDVVPAKASPVALRVASMPFAFAPVVTGGGKTATLGFATFRPAFECPQDAVVARREGERLVLAEPDARLIDSLAGAAVVIYLEKSQP